MNRVQFPKIKGFIAVSPINIHPVICKAFFFVRSFLNPSLVNYTKFVLIISGHTAKRPKGHTLVHNIKSINDILSL